MCIFYSKNILEICRWKCAEAWQMIYEIKINARVLLSLMMRAKKQAINTKNHKKSDSTESFGLKVNIFYTSSALIKEWIVTSL